MTPLGRMVQVLLSNKKSKLVACGSRLEQQSIAVDQVISNEYLLTDILLRVPPKELLSSILVSKHWLSIISDPDFCSSHAHRNTKSSLVAGLYIYKTRKLPNLRASIIPVFGSYQNLPTLYFPELGRSLNILDSCNGLMLCTGGFFHAVCNPTTRKYKVLPNPRRGSLPLQRSGCLDFDPSKSPHYKVIAVVQWYNSYQIDIYSSENSSWKRSVVPSIEGHSPLAGRIVSWNGAIHWISELRSYLRYNVVAEDLIATPKLRLPKDCPNMGILYFGECGGRLFLVHYVRSSRRREFLICEMKSGNSSWTIRCKFNVLSLANELAAMNNHILILTIVKGENDDDFSLVISTGNGVKLYNFKSKVVKVLVHSLSDFAREQSAYLVDYAHRYFESLSPV